MFSNFIDAPESEQTQIDNFDRAMYAKIKQDGDVDVGEFLSSYQGSVPAGFDARVRAEDIIASAKLAGVL